MKKLHFLAMVVIACVMTSCLFKTEATVDVQVLRPDGTKAPAGVVVYKFVGTDKSTIYKSNADGASPTNAAGVAHFDLRSPDDLGPSSVGDVEQETFRFCTYEGNTRNGETAVTIYTGQHRDITLQQETPSQD